MTEEKQTKRKAGRPAISPEIKKKSCNILLTPKEIHNLDFIASHYDLNKSSFIALLINKLFPHLQNFIYKPKAMYKYDYDMAKQINSCLKVEPSSDNVFKQKIKYRTTSKANVANHYYRKRYDEVVKVNEELDREVDRLNEQLDFDKKLNQSTEDKLYSDLEYYMKRLKEEEQKNRELEKALQNKK